MIVYDVGEKKSFENVRTWVNHVQDHGIDCKGMILLGNTTGSEDKRQVTREMGEQLASELKMPFMELDFKSGENIQSAFAALARCIIAKMTKIEEKSKYDKKRMCVSICGVCFPCCFS